jgi:hypothetical protein
MSASTPLFDVPPVSRYAPDDLCAGKHGGAETSEAVHSAIRESKERTRRRILDFLTRRGSCGATWQEISDELGIAYACSGRVSEMKRDGRVLESGERRLTRSGHEAFVVVLARFGKEMPS